MEETKTNETQANKENIKPKLVYTLDDIEIKKIEVDKNVFLRVLSVGSKKYVDLRKFYKGYPTKKGIRLAYDLFSNVLDKFNDI